MRPQEGIILRLKGLYFSLLLGFFGVLASLGNLAALNLGLAKPDTHAGSSVAGRVRIEGQLPQPNRISIVRGPELRQGASRARCQRRIRDGKWRRAR